MKRKKLIQLKGQTTLPFRPLSLDQSVKIGDKHGLFTETDSEFEEERQETAGYQSQSAPVLQSCRSPRNISPVDSSSESSESEDELDEWQPSNESARVPHS